MYVLWETFKRGHHLCKTSTAMGYATWLTDSKNNFSPVFTFIKE